MGQEGFVSASRTFKHFRAALLARLSSSSDTPPLPLCHRRPSRRFGRTSRMNVNAVQRGGSKKAECTAPGPRHGCMKNASEKAEDLPTDNQMLLPSRPILSDNRRSGVTSHLPVLRGVPSEFSAHPTCSSTSMFRSPFCNPRASRQQPRSRRDRKSVV